MNTYANKSNARRAAKAAAAKAGHNFDHYSITQTPDGLFTYSYEAPAAPAKRSTNKVPASIRRVSETEAPCNTVHYIASKLFAANPDTKRRDVLAACEKAGIAYYTARTQYQVWREKQREEAEVQG